VSSAVKPEFGPTLPELLGPRLRSWPRWGRFAFWGAIVFVVLVVLWALVLRGDGRTPVVVREPVAFNLLINDKLVRVQPRAGESLRLQTPASDPDPESVVVRPVVLPAYTGDTSGVLPVYASALIERMRAADPNFILRSEGRARVNSQPGYQIQYQTSRGGRTVYGRRALLFVDEPGTREGADISLESVRSPSIPNVDQVGSNGPTKLPYRSLRLGTERP
jgi:hypothetical protein